MTTASGANKGLQSVGHERGYWDASGKVEGASKALTLEEMKTKLKGDPDFKYCPTILEDTVKHYNDTRKSEGRHCEFEVALLSKFWCTLAFVEQYWNDVKRVTREQCDYTMPRLKAVFPVALATACPVTQIRKYMRRSLDHVDALLELGRDGDFSKIPSLRKKYKSHRRAELIRLGTISEEKKRDRKNWGSVQRARRLDPAMEVEPTPEETLAQAAAIEAEAEAAAASVAHALKLERTYNAAALVRKAELAVISAAACAKAIEEAAEAAMEAAEEAAIDEAERRANRAAALSSSSSSSSSSVLPVFMEDDEGEEEAAPPEGEEARPPVVGFLLAESRSRTRNAPGHFSDFV